MGFVRVNQIKLIVNIYLLDAENVCIHVGKRDKREKVKESIFFFFNFLLAAEIHFFPSVFVIYSHLN